MNVLTSDGNVAINGTFSNFTDPAKAKYNGQVITNNLQVGKILRQQNTIGSLSATITANGQGLTPNAINTKFSAVITSVSYHQYQYKNIALSGSLKKTDFDVPNDQRSQCRCGYSSQWKFSDHPAFTVHGMIDSVKTLPLHLTTEPLIITGKN